MFAAFVKSLEASCSGKGIGFGHAVFDRDRLFKADGDGKAVRAVKKAGKVVVPSVHFTEKTRLNVHSISKTTCAAIIVRALHLNRDVSLDSPIGLFLRPYQLQQRRSHIRRPRRSEGDESTPDRR